MSDYFIAEAMDDLTTSKRDDLDNRMQKFLKEFEPRDIYDDPNELAHKVHGIRNAEILDLTLDQAQERVTGARTYLYRLDHIVGSGVRVEHERHEDALKTLFSEIQGCEGRYLEEDNSYIIERGESVFL